MENGRFPAAAPLALWLSLLAAGCGPPYQGPPEKPPPGIPAAPSALDATPGNGQVTLAWPAVAAALTYNLYWSLTPTASSNGTKVTGVTSPYVHAGLTNGVPVYYVVTAVNQDGESPPSPVASATPSATATSTSALLPRTGQISCYDEAGTAVACAGTGQDGEKLAGVAWPAARFTGNGDGTITDNLTGLMWLQDADCLGQLYPDLDLDREPRDGMVFWAHALSFVAGVNGGGQSGCRAGHADWRLPNRRELRSLVNYEQGSSATWLTAQGFTHVTSPYYFWTSTSYAGWTGGAWQMEVNLGREVYEYKTSHGYVWLVRSAGSGAVALGRTGQVSCFAEDGAGVTCAGSGQDGATLAGLAWPAPRFEVAASGTGSVVADHLTGLVWAGDGGTLTFTGAVSTCTGGAVTWQAALDYVACLNQNGYLGYGDWRLPNLNEMESLVHAGYDGATCSGVPCASNAAWLGSQGFTRAQEAAYWTSTSVASLPSAAWRVSLFDGTVDSYGGKQDAAAVSHAWPVRNAH